MRALADRLGIRAPSLYKHIGGKDELEDALLGAALEELGALIVRSTDGGRDPLTALADACRRFGLKHPNLFPLLTLRPGLTGHPPGPEEARATALVAAAAGGRDRALAVWAFANGMVLLELAGRFPTGADLDAAWQAGIDAFRRERGAARLPVVRTWRGPD
jgi:AcrR family transcriptional regulator